jgi:hypothetical protein
MIRKTISANRCPSIFCRKVHYVCLSAGVLGAGRPAQVCLGARLGDTFVARRRIPGAAARGLTVNEAVPTHSAALASLGAEVRLLGTATTGAPIKTH